MMGYDKYTVSYRIVSDLAQTLILRLEYHRIPMCYKWCWFIAGLSAGSKVSLGYG